MQVNHLRREDLDERLHGVLEERPGRLGPLGGLVDIVGALRPHRAEDLVLGVVQQALEVLERERREGYCCSLRL